MSKQNEERRRPAPDESFSFSRWSDELERELQQHLESISLMVRPRLWAQILLAMILGLGLGLQISPKGAGLVDPQLSLTIEAAGLHLPQPDPDGGHPSGALLHHPGDLLQR